jgi:lipopolysaccharide export system permease protein
LVVLTSSGLSPLQLARPALLLGVVVTLLCYGLSLYLMPVTKHQFKDVQTFLRDNYTSVLLQEEVFNSPVDGLTVFVRRRDDDGILHGVLVHDSRIPGADVTMMAEQARLVQTPSGPRFYLSGGMRQEMRDGRISWLDFDSYNLDISLYTENQTIRRRTPEELLPAALLDPNLTNQQLIRQYRAELHQRLTWPPYALGLALLAATALLRGEFSRRGQWKRIAVLSAAATGIILAAIGLSNMMVQHPALIPLNYFVMILIIGGALAFLAYTPHREIPAYENMSSA